MGEGNSGGRPGMKYVERQKLTYVALLDSLAFENDSIEWSKSHLAEVRIPIVRVYIVGSNASWLAYATYWQVCVAGDTDNGTDNDTQQ